MPETLPRIIPRRFEGQDLAGLGDLLDDYTRAVSDFSDAYVWLMRSRDAVVKTGSQKLIDKYNDLLMKGEGWRQMIAAYQIQPNVWNWLSNLFGTVTNWSSITVGGKILSTTELGGIVHGLQEMITEIHALKQAVEQYRRLVSSGVPAAEASRVIDEAHTTFLDRAASTLKFGLGMGTIALILAAIVFLPEIKMLIRGKLK